MVFVDFIDVAGTLTWHASAAHAHSLGGRLPTKKEVKKAIQAHGGQPLFSIDIWVPVSNAPDTWVSVGNCETHIRLGKTHTELFGVPGWTNDSSFHAYRVKLGVVHGRVRYVSCPTTTTYSGAVALAASMGCRLATKGEVQASIAANHNAPIFGVDVWVPVCDKAHKWVSVGNCEPHLRLGKSHTRLFGVPAWTEDHGSHAYRSQLAIVSAVFWVNVPGTHGWHAANAFAASKGCRLANVHELKHEVSRNGNAPLFGEDTWAPASDAADTWVSVGNCEPHIRLAKTHTELFGVPGWSNDGSHHNFRHHLALVSLH